MPEPQKTSLHILYVLKGKPSLGMLNIDIDYFSSHLIVIYTASGTS